MGESDTPVHIPFFVITRKEGCLVIVGRLDWVRILESIIIFGFGVWRTV